MECGQIHSFLMPDRCRVFLTDSHKMLGFLDRTQQRLTSNSEPCEDVGFS